MIVPILCLDRLSRGLAAWTTSFPFIQLERSTGMPAHRAPTVATNPIDVAANDLSKSELSTALYNLVQSKCVRA